MADTKISAEPAASTLDGTEKYVGVQGGANVMITGNQIKADIRTDENTWTDYNTFDSVTGSAGGIKFTDSSAPAQTAYWLLHAQNFVYTGVNDFTLGLHYNVDPAQPANRVDTAQPSFAWNWEPYYKDGAAGQGLLEHNWTYGSIDGTVNFRPHSFSINLVTHIPDWNYQGTIHVQHRSNANYALIVNPLATGNGGLTTVGGQLSVIGTSGLSNFASISGDIGGAGALLGIFPSVLYSGGTALQISGSGTLTGNYDAVGSSANVSGILQLYMKNHHASGAVCNFLWAGGTGDSFARFLTGSFDWSVGVDNSDGGKWKVSKSSTLGSGEALSIDVNNNVLVGNAALATTATNGFLHIPTCAGPPTGVPTLHTGRVPLVYDTTNQVLYIYAGGAWRGLTNPGVWG